MSAPFMIGFMGFAIDLAMWEGSKIGVQGAADQAALAAGRAYRTGASITTEARAIGASYGFVNAVAGATVNINRPPLAGTFAGNSAAVEVVISQTQKSYFSDMIRPTAPVVTARSVAAPDGGANGGLCIMTLKTTNTTLSLNGTNTVDVADCNIYDNSNNASSVALGGTAIMKALNIYLRGGYSKGSNATFVVGHVLSTYGSATPDPYTSRVMPSFSGCNATNAEHSASASYNAAGGVFVFCGDLKLTGSGNTLTLGSGTYIFDKSSMTINGGWTVNATAATLIFTNSATGTGSGVTSAIGSVKINGGQVLNFQAPSTGATKGMALWIDGRATSSTLGLGGGNTLNIVGAIYAPSTDVTISGNSGSACTQVVAYTIDLNGNNTFRHDCGGIGVSDPPGSLPVLALVE